MGLAVIIPFSNFSQKNLGKVSLDTAFPVSYDLTLCDVSGEKPDSVIVRGQLSVQLQPKNSFCSPVSVIVTMGGNDVTAEVYNAGAITIPAVIGAVEIRAVYGYTLPSGYTKKDSIIVPSGAYFNTGITPTANTSFYYEYEIDPTIYTDTGKAPHFLSGSNYFAPFCRTKYSSDETIFANRLGAETATVYVGVAPYRVKFDAYNEGDRVFCNGESYINLSPGTATPGNLYLCCYGGAATTQKYWFKGTIYGAVEIYDGGIPVSIMVPAKNSNNTVGFYDVVRNAFYTSSTSKAFQ